MSTKKWIRLAGALAVCMAAAGCATMAPPYSAQVSNTVALKSANAMHVRVGAIGKPTPGHGVPDVDSISVRGGKYQSPYGSFTQYFREALKTELDHADLLDEKSDCTIVGTLTKNDLDASGFSIGTADLEAELEVHRGDRVLYRATKSTHSEWPSSMVGAIAIPRAINNYPVAVQQLINAFVTDPAFIAAIKKP